MSKFSNCFIDQKPDYKYPIKLDGEQFAMAKTLSARDQGELMKLHKRRLVDGEMVVEINDNGIEVLIKTIELALTEWEADRPLTADNIAMLPLDVMADIVNQINAHQEGTREAVEDSSKN